MLSARGCVATVRVTHGKPGIIDEPARLVRADAVVHDGDFGSFDQKSVERLSNRELELDDPATLHEIPIEIDGFEGSAAAQGKEVDLQ